MGSLDRVIARLSSRQATILKLLSRGLRNVEIAQHIGLSGAL